MANFYFYFQGGQKAAKSGNQALSDSLTSWVFKEEGVLRVGKVVHHKAGEKEPPQYYTITENMVRMTITQFCCDKFS